MPRRPNWLLELQGWLAGLFCWGLFVPILWLRLVRNYRLGDGRALRDAYRRLALDVSGPLIIVANHPNRLDGLLLLWALASPFTYARRPRRYPWIVNDPAVFWFPRGLWKCIRLSQGAGVHRNRRAWQELEYVLQKGEAVLIFPDGTREDDRPSYLVGSLLKKFPRAVVVGASLQPVRRGAFWERPPRGTCFQITLAPFSVATEARGARAVWELSVHVHEALRKMLTGRGEAT